MVSIQAGQWYKPKMDLTSRFFRKIYLSITFLENVQKFCNMEPFEKILPAVFYQVMRILIIPKSLETKLFIADEDVW